MRVCGVICEYNPFHNGHAYHLHAARMQTGCDFVICVMSGAFTQRGEAAVISKWARAEMALRHGADVVLELPTLFAVRDAERFARGGVSLLDMLGVVTHLCFGSESGDMALLQGLAKVEGDITAIRAGLARGMTLARARGEALGLDADAPNDTLAVEYLRAIMYLKSEITPVTIRREGSGYHDTALGTMASATAIRQAIAQGADVYDSVPPAAYALLQRLLAAGAYHPAEGLDTVLLATLRQMEADRLAQVADVGEGLENRLLHAAQDATSRESLLTLCKCKRYTWARLSRVATQAMLGMDKALADAYPLPTYARLLGFRREAQPLLAAIKQQATVLLITRAAKYRGSGDAAFGLDIRAGDLWTLGMQNASYRKGSTDLTQGVVIID